MNLITAIFVVGANSLDFDVELGLDQITERFEHSIELRSLFQTFNEDNVGIIIGEDNKITGAVIGFNERLANIGMNEIKRLIRMLIGISLVF